MPAVEVGGRGVGVAITEQQDKDQEGGERRMGRGRTSPNT